jgi:hypothetical protein
MKFSTIDSGFVRRFVRESVRLDGTYVCFGMSPQSFQPLHAFVLFVDHLSSEALNNNKFYPYMRKTEKPEMLAKLYERYRKYIHSFLHSSDKRIQGNLYKLEAVSNSLRVLNIVFPDNVSSLAVVLVLTFSSELPYSR